MRSLLTLLALALAPAHAQGTPPTTPDAACTTGEIYAGGAPVTPSYRWTEPATAVAAARQQVLSTQWTVTCLTYRIRSDGQRVTIQSLTTNPQDALTPLRPLEFYTSGFYRYPALRLGWTGQRIDVTWNGQQVHVSGQVLDDVILVTRTPDGTLTRITPTAAGVSLPLDRFELYLKLTTPIIPPSWTALTYDARTGTVTLDRASPFPK